MRFASFVGKVKLHAAAFGHDGEGAPKVESGGGGQPVAAVLSGPIYHQVPFFFHSHAPHPQLLCDPAAPTPVAPTPGGSTTADGFRSCTATRLP